MLIVAVEACVMWLPRALSLSALVGGVRADFLRSCAAIAADAEDWLNH